MDGSESTEAEQVEVFDAVDVVKAFLEDRCEVEIGSQFFVGKDQLREALEAFCEERRMETPNSETLGFVLTRCFFVFSARVFLVCGRQPIEVWRNVRLKDEFNGPVIM